MLAAAVIVFREVLEAGLIVGVVLASTRGVARRSAWVALGVGAGLLGACLLAAFAGSLAAAFEGAGQELFHASVLLFAVGMLAWHNAWMAGHGRALAAEARRLGSAVAAGRKPLLALSVICGTALLREGSETVLFLAGVAAAGAGSAASLAVGGALGLAAALAVVALLYAGLLAVPARRIFAVTSTLVSLLAAGLAAQAVALLQQAGYVQIGTATVWDTSGILPEDSVVGRLLHALVGYTDRPSGAQVVAYLVVLALMAGVGTLARRIAVRSSGRNVPAETAGARG